MKYQIGEKYYQDHNTLYNETPYEWEWKCIARAETGEPIFERLNHERIFNVHSIQSLSQFGFGHEFYTKEEIEKKWANEREKIKEKLSTQKGILQFMIESIENYIQRFEYGYIFTTEEKKQFTKRLKEEFELDINMEG